jgi:hypothetical protein
MALSFWDKRRLIRESSLSIQIKWLLTVLADYAGEKEWSFPSQTTLARDLSVTRRHVISLLKQAISKKKVIEVKRRRRQTNEYRIAWDALSELQVTIETVLDVNSGAPCCEPQSTPCCEPQSTSDVNHTSHRTSIEHPKITSKENKSEKNGKQIEEIYQAYPRKVAKPKALKAIEAALKKTSYDELLSAVSEYAKSRDGQDSKYTPHPATWFNAERWHDDRNEWKSSNGRPGKRQVSPGEEFDPEHTAVL